MSIISRAFDDFITFIDTSFNGPGYGQTGGPIGPPTAPPSASFPNMSEMGKYADPAIRIFGPLITAAVARPERPKFPSVPDSVKNDPRVQNLLGSYGALDGTLPSIKDPSTFQMAFPAMMSAATKWVGQEFAPEPLPTAKTTPEAPGIPPTETTEGTVLANDTAAGMSTRSDIRSADKLGVNQTSKYDDLIVDSSKQEKIDPNIMRAIIQHESNFDANAEGDKDPVTGEYKSFGMGQMGYAAAHDVAGRDVTKEELKDPFTGIPLIAKHIAKLHKIYGGDVGDPDYAKTISAYNAGVTGSSNPRVYNSSQLRAYRTGVQRIYRTLVPSITYRHEGLT